MFQKRIILLRLLLFLSILIWYTGIFYNLLIPPNNKAFILSPFIHKFYSSVCHQTDYKTISINGKTLMVCSRCTGLYTGAFLSAFFILLYLKRFKLNTKVLYFSFIPVISDIILYHFGFYSYSKAAAFSTGLFSGSILFIYILASFENSFFVKSKILDDR